MQIVVFSKKVQNFFLNPSKNKTAENQEKSQLLFIGIAFFAMMFGGGSIVLSLALGRDSGNRVGWSLLGFIGTTVLLPVLGLISALFYSGNYQQFFGRIGRLPGAVIIFVCMVLIGPFGVIPRLLATAHSAIRWYFPHYSLLQFSFLASFILILCTLKKNNMMHLIGKFLGPVKLFLLLTLIVFGLFFGKRELMQMDLSITGALLNGIADGYSTMDLLAVIFFAEPIASSLSARQGTKSIDCKQLALDGIKVGGIGAILLSLVYAGLCLVAAYHGPKVMDIDRYELLNALAPLILGYYSGMFTSAIMAVACLVSAIALVGVFTNYLCHIVFKNRIQHTSALMMTIVTAAIMTNLGFNGIMALIGPIAVFCYPAIIVLVVVNLAYRLFGFQWVRVPVFATLLITLLFRMYYVYF
jgi:LIVCS family branched-chain amino acid:cation transporter